MLDIILCVNFVCGCDCVCDEEDEDEDCGVDSSELVFISSLRFFRRICFVVDNDGSSLVTAVSIPTVSPTN